MARQYRSTRSFRLSSLVVFLVLGVGFLASGGYRLADDSVVCDRQVMNPGDRCLTSDGDYDYAGQAAARRGRGRTLMLVSLVPFAFAGLSLFDVVRNGDLRLPRIRRPARRARRRPHRALRDWYVQRSVDRLTARTERLERRRERLRPDYERALKYQNDPERAPAHRDRVIRRYRRNDESIRRVRERRQTRRRTRRR